VIDDTMAERMVTCGWLAAAIAGSLMIAMTFYAPAGAFKLVYFLGAAVLFALAYGIYRRSRVCAIVVLANHFLGAVGLVLQPHAVPPAQIAIALLLGVLYVLGAIGTFVHHAHLSPAAA
jgi:serine/threonine-protein kinase